MTTSKVSGGFRLPLAPAFAAQAVGLSLLAWALPDEPDDVTTQVPFAKVQRTYRSWKRIDPRLPVYINFNGQFNQHDVKTNAGGTYKPMATKKFDFGVPGAAVARRAAGYTAVEETGYTTALGYGWQSGTISSVDNGGSTDPLTGDYNATANGTFGVDLSDVVSGGSLLDDFFIQEAALTGTVTVAAPDIDATARLASRST